MSSPVCLPQSDSSPDRTEELAGIRARYQWDYDILRPIPFLKVGGVQDTGVLAIADVVIGSYVGLPVEERPPADFLIAKLVGSLPQLYDLLNKVPMVEWVKLFGSVSSTLKSDSEGWADQLVRAVITGVLSSASNSDDDTISSTGAAVSTALYDLLIDIGVSFGVSIENNRGVIATVISAVQNLFGREETAGDSLEVVAEKARAAGLPDSALAVLLPLQAMLRFASDITTKGMIPESGQPEWKNLFSFLVMPDMIDPLQDDQEFARRTLAGLNPVLITRVSALTDLPESFAVDDALLHRALAAHGLDVPEDNLASAASAGRLYHTDYAILADLPCQSGPDRDFFGRELGEETARQRYLPAPRALLYQHPEGRLLPVAIQLGQTAEDEVFTPADGAELWHRIKLLYAVADFNHHELATHLFSVHFFLEAVVVTSARQLHPRHPVGVLLHRHFQWLLWNNFIGRQLLSNPTGLLDQLMSGELEAGTLEVMKRRYREFDFSELNFPEELKQRGVHDPALLPDYPLRDDGLKMWNAIHRFVSEYVALYYPDDATLLADTELGAWGRELAGSEAEDGAHVPGFPEAITSPGQLADILTGFLFRTGPFHCAVNYGQYDLGGRPIITPMAAYADPREVRQRGWREYVASGEVSFTQSSALWVLTSMKDDTYTDYALDWFTDPRTWPLVAAFRVHLAEIEAEIEAVNETREVPYTLLMPSQVTVTSNV
ncbi:MAG: arachidonate 15-lipoxygenase [Myxococcota bacterium]|jgi:arachidonate 15-lipoxygenase